MVIVPSKLFSRLFASKVCRRGSSYYYNGHVHIKKGTDTSVDAVVEGSSNYKVTFVLNDAKLGINCTCPYFQDWEEPCKHIWATLLASEVRDYLKEVTAKRASSFHYNKEEENNKSYASASNYPSTVAALSPYKEPAQPIRPPSWESCLNTITSDMESDELSSCERWPAEREVIYIFDVFRTLSQKIKS